MMVTINLKSGITFRVDLGDGRPAAFTTKAFLATKAPDTIPEPKQHVGFDVTAIAISDDHTSWLTLREPIRISILWSNVLSVQHHEAAR